MKVGGRSDGKFIGDRKDGVMEEQGHGSFRAAARD